jgi:thioredoxin reductase (NADPH)
VTLDDGTELIARAVLLATGVSFRWLDAPGCGPLVGAGIYYGAAMAEASACRDQEIYILGGGNSAGQAALLLAQYARRVNILTANDSLDETMSKYLVERIANTHNIDVKTNATVVGAEGGTHLEWITVQDLKTGETRRVPASGLFVFIGATPNTDWLADTVERDEEGFVVSGFDCQQSGGRPVNWPLHRPQYPLETNRAGVFVAGDVRKNSVKRLTVATGEGAMSVQFIHLHCAASFA